MKSLVRFAALSPILLFAFGACSLSENTSDNPAEESVTNVAMADGTYTASYASDYLAPAITTPTGLTFHQITMNWYRNNLDAGGTCVIDPNLCALDEFGDRTLCTKLAIAGSEMKLTLFAEKTGYRAYAIGFRPYGSTDDYTAMPWRLVTFTPQAGEPAQGRLLILNSDQTIDRIIELNASRNR
jgi:hypothetical protein